jgi:hypothetical protein
MADSEDPKNKNGKRVRFTEVVIPELQPEELKIKLKKKRPVPIGLPAVPFLGGIFGSRGSGKTTAFIKLARLYDTTKSFDNVIVFSPTLCNDEKEEALKTDTHFKCQVVNGFSDIEFGKFVTHANKELHAFERFDKARDAWHKYKNGCPIESLSREELEHLSFYDFRNPDEMGVFPHGRPSFLMVFDDLVGDQRVYAENMSNTVCRFALRHRHSNTSILFLAQCFAKGVPRQIRNNVSIAMLFSNKSLHMKKDIAEEMSSFLEPKAFLDMWDYATEDLHDFFMVDYDAHDLRLKFRKNFNVLLVPPEGSLTLAGADTAGMMDVAKHIASRGTNKRKAPLHEHKDTKDKPHPSTVVYGKKKPVGAGGVKGASRFGADPCFAGALGRKNKRKA